MSILAAAVVQIIGLAVLRNDSEMNGMHVVLPRVAAASHVESHSAILVFKTSDRVDDGSEWASFPLTPLPGYSYVKLKGERIRFIVNGENPLATIPTALPRLTNGCTAMIKLSKGFRPRRYAAAAAVVLIPKGNASACLGTPHGRIDTRISMANSGNYRVIANRKKITLRDNALIMILNVATTWVEGTDATTLPSDAHHSRVYFHMALETLQARETCSLHRTAESIEPCDSAQFAPAIMNNSGVFELTAAIDHSSYQTYSDFPLGVMPSSTFECSNTQWP